MKKFFTLKMKRNGGFTLVELIVVIAILAILAAILIPLVSGYIGDAKDATGAANARTVYTAATAYLASELSKNTTFTDGQTIAGTALQNYLGSNFSGGASATVNVSDDGAVEISSATWTDTTTSVSYVFHPSTSTTSHGPATT